jgi:3,4-dihydroxyphenylacetate 2,3-dioxygenase
MPNLVPTPVAPAPDILRCAYMELVVTDLAASRAFYVDVLGLVVTEEDDTAIYLRSLEEFIHHNLVLKKGPIAAVGALSFRVRSPEDVDKAEAYFAELGCTMKRSKSGFSRGIGDSLRVVDPLGFPYEFFYEVDHVERLAWRYELHTPGALVRLDHFNQVTPDVPRAVNYIEDLGFRVTEDIRDADGIVYAAWARRKDTVHDTAMTGGDGPRVHHVAFSTHEKHNIIAICDKLGALRLSDHIERGLMVTVSRFILRITTPATPTTPSSHGTCTTTSVVTGGATRSCQAGTPRHPSFSTSTAMFSRSFPGQTPRRWRRPLVLTASRTPAKTTKTTVSSWATSSDADHGTSKKASRRESARPLFNSVVSY